MIFVFITLVVLGQLVSADQQQQLALSSAVSNFSQRLYQKIALDTSKVVYSPYSIHSDLTTAYFIARGDTEKELETTLGIASLGNLVHETYQELLQQMKTITDVELFNIAGLYRRTFARRNTNFFLDRKKYYSFKAASHILSASYGLKKYINDDIANRTKNKINDLLQPESIINDESIMLISTFYFNATWEKKFAKLRTITQVFYQLGGTLKEVDMITDDRYVNIKRDDANKVDVAELPFKGGRFSLYIALPRELDGITDLERLLDQPDQVNQLFIGLTSVLARLAIPKFKTENMLNLITPLKRMGIVKAFQKGLGNFTQIAKDPTFFSEVLHKARIEIGEMGTVMGSAAARKGMRFSGPLNPNETFIADHPFVYFLRDNPTGQILLQGKFSA